MIYRKVDQQFKLANSQIGKLAHSQFHNFAISETSRFRNFTISQFCKFAMSLFRNFANCEISHSNTRVRNFAISQFPAKAHETPRRPRGGSQFHNVDNFANAQLCNFATLCNSTSSAISQCCNCAIYNFANFIIFDNVKSWRSDYERMCEAEPEIRNMMSFDEFK